MKSTIDPTAAAQFDRRARMIVQWQEAARELVAAANCVYRRFEVVQRRKSNHKRRSYSSSYVSVGIFMMLYGLAAENLLKALLIARGWVPAKDGRLNSFFAKHCLREYTRHARLTMTVGEEGLLDQLERAITVGRYPVATDATKETGLWIVIAHEDEVLPPTDPTQPGIISLLECIESKIRRVKPTHLLPAVRFDRLGLAPVRTGGPTVRRRSRFGGQVANDARPAISTAANV